MHSARYEYKHVRWQMSWSCVFSHDAWERQLMTLLTEHGSAGWELKSVIYEYTFHYHLIFARAVPPGVPVKWTPAECVCGYNLAGNVSGVCPECGRRVEYYAASQWSAKGGEHDHE